MQSQLCALFASAELLYVLCMAFNACCECLRQSEIDMSSRAYPPGYVALTLIIKVACSAQT